MRCQSGNPKACNCLGIPTLEGYNNASCAPTTTTPTTTTKDGPTTFHPKIIRPSLHVLPLPPLPSPLSPQNPSARPSRAFVFLRCFCFSQACPRLVRRGAFWGTGIAPCQVCHQRIRRYVLLLAFLSSCGHLYSRATIVAFRQGELWHVVLKNETF